MSAPFYRDDAVTVYHGDCLDVLADLPDASVDSVVTDPPYGLDFMGKHWDTGAVAFDTAIWGHCLRVLKPGGHLLAFGGTRTWHRLAVAIEDAGFEIRDNIAWLYGSGFPKSLDVSKAIDKAAGAEREVVGKRNRILNRTPTDKWVKSNEPSVIRQGDAGLTASSGVWSKVTAPATDDAKRWAGWGTALKPAFEPVVVARKPLSGTVAANVLAHGVGALNIDGCRVEFASESDRESAQALADLRAKGRRLGVLGEPGQGSSLAAAVSGDTRTGNEQTKTHTAGRWPSNVVIDGHAAAEIDRQSGVSVSGIRKENGNSHIRADSYTPDRGAGGDRGHSDEGGASRFFPTFKYQAKAPSDERPTADGVSHPTVKPLDLMRWLVRLVTPPGGTVLEPFAGSGTTAEACIHEHMKCIAIEREADYLPLIVARLSKPMEIGFDFGEAS